MGLTLRFLPITPPQPDQHPQPATRRIIELVDDAPGQVLVKLTLEDTVLLSRITRKSAHALGLQPGMNVIA